MIAAKNSVGVLVSCTKKKRQDVPDRLHFRNVPPGPAPEVAERWLERLRKVANPLPATEMYAGTGWSRSLATLDHASRVFDQAQLFVLSAGLGFVAADHPIPAYSATFAPDPDRIADFIHECGSITGRHRAWWHVMTALGGLSGQSLIDELTAHDIVFAGLGADYLLAALRDLEEISCRLGPERFYLVCAGAKSAHLPSSIASCLLPVDTSIECHLRIARAALNEAVLNWVLARLTETSDVSRDAINQLISPVMEDCQRQWQNQSSRVVTASDAEINSWIRGRLWVDPHIARTALLKEFRRQRSCEQARFKRLYENVRKDMGLF